MPLLQKNNKFDQIFTGKTFIYRKITCDHRDHSCRSCVTQPDTKRRYTRGSLLPQHVPATRSRSKAPSSAPTISSEKMLCNKTFAPVFCSLISNWFDMREHAPGANLLHESVLGASSLVCTEICLPWNDVHVSPVGQSNWLIFHLRLIGNSLSKWWTKE